MDAKPVPRRYDLDWLRVLGILLVFIYHSSRFYNMEDWILKNKTWYPAVEVWNLFATSFMMPLMFVISGASLYYAIGKGGFGKFVKDKVLRLLVPLLVGIFTHASLQSYLYAKTHGLFNGGYFQFLPFYYQLDRIDWNGMHLWYLRYLFLFSIILYPLMRWLKAGGCNFLTQLNGVLAKAGVVYVLALPILLLHLLPPDAPLMDGNGGYPYLMYLFFILWGFLIASDERLQDRIRQSRWVFLATGLILAAGSGMLLIQIPDKDTLSTGLILGGAMRVFGGWICVLAILGLGMAYLTVRSARLDYANEAVLPFYIFHQTVLLATGYFVLQWDLPEILEWAVIVAISFVIIMTLYEFAVRRFNVMRVLFGMKLLTKPPLAQTLKPQFKETIP